MLATKGMRFPIDVILVCIRWYAAYPLSYRHLEEIMQERGVFVDGVVQTSRFSGNTDVTTPPSKVRDFWCDLGIEGGLFHPRWVRPAKAAAARTQAA